INGTLDFSAAPMYHTIYRIEVASPGQPREVKKTPMFYRRHVGVDTKVLSIFEVFSYRLWIVIGSTLAIFTVLLVQGKPKKTLHALNQVVKALLGQAELDASKWVWYRCLTFFLAIYGAFLYWSYSGMLISNLATAKKGLPFQTIQEFVAKPNLKIYTFKGTAPLGIVLQSVDPKHENELRERLETTVFTNENESEVFTKIFKGSGVANEGIFSESKFFYSRLNKSGFDQCEADFFYASDVPKIPYGYMYPFDSMLQPLFDKFMIDLITYGLVDEILSSYGNSNPASCTQISNFQSVNFEFVQVLFYFLSGGVILGLIILIFELYSKK
ncbi:MAG: hypothetical protein ACPHVX_07415, partial [Flavobacteriaceae bacterium]